MMLTGNSGIMLICYAYVVLFEVILSHILMVDFVGSCSGLLETVVEDGDVIVFISTLHGG